MVASSQTVLAGLAAAGTVAAAGSLADIDHVVLFMQENRAFDHYFGTMAGVRNFKDPNVQLNNGTPVFYQEVTPALSNKSDSLLPWYLNAAGGIYPNATQCMEAGSNGWTQNQDALNGGLNNLWAVDNTPYSWGHFTREELPNHFAIAEGWTVGDSYQEGVITSTNPNRVTWASGTINAPGSPNNNGKGMYIDNTESPGCESKGLNCYPLTWKTYPEYLQDAGVTWQTWQDTDNFDDNPLAWFKQFQQAKNTSELAKRGLTFLGLEGFYEAAAQGTLPEVSYIIGPAELSEHPPYQPKDGAWLQQKIVDVVTSSPKYNSTVLMISYDETGGWGDHVVPFHSPPGTVGEWVTNPYGSGQVYTGPGFRLPFYIISPWTRGGNVYTEHADHNSQILFLEKWLAAKGKAVVTEQMNTWRRENMADLTMAFDFANPDYSIPSMPNASYPSTNSQGQWNGYAVCEATYPDPQPPVPYGLQNAKTALETEQGFKSVRGYLTEGRYLTFEMNGYALSHVDGALKATKASAQHNAADQRWVIHGDGPTFVVTNAAKNKTVSGFGATTFTDLGNGQGYTLKNEKGLYMAISSSGAVSTSKNAAGFSIFSVTYD